ncbi:MAG: voltage-gated potassium channel [Crocinitomix sp.]|jgi:voltage-gated potassium channel
MNDFFTKLGRIKHEIVLLSLLIVLFGPLFVSEEINELINPLFFAQTLFVGIILFENKRILKYLFIGFLIIVLSLYLLNFFSDAIQLKLIPRGIYIASFLVIAYETYIQIYRTKEVSRAMVSAVFTGFILLCLIAGLYFALIEAIAPNSFSNLGSPAEQYGNLSYFSFITTLTIGYGDIVPLTLHAKKATMLIGLIGNFYSVIVTGIIIGKYLNRKD